MIDDRFTRTVTVHGVTSTTVDEYGNPVSVETDTDVVGHYRQLSADELGTAEVRDTAYRVYLPAGTAIGPEDRLTLDNGVTVEVIGLATERYNPRTGLIICKTVDAEVAA